MNSGPLPLSDFASLRLGEPSYRTRLGAAYCGDSRELLSKMPASSIDLIMTSPPFALRRKKEYGNVDAEDYVRWFRPFARQFKRVLKKSGSLVVDIGGTWIPGEPSRSLYQYELLIDLSHLGFKLCQEFFWYNPSKLPSPAEWVTVRRIRVKDAVNPVWWMSKTAYPEADNRRVLNAYSQSMLDLIEGGYKAKLRPSGWDISKKFQVNRGGSIPPNLLEFAHTESNSRYLRACRAASVSPHPARFPVRLPEFFIRYLTKPGALVLDPFAGSNVTGEAAERNDRRWIGIELRADYLEGSRFRFSGTASAGAPGVKPTQNEARTGSRTVSAVAIT